MMTASVASASHARRSRPAVRTQPPTVAGAPAHPALLLPTEKIASDCDLSGAKPWLPMMAHGGVCLRPIEQLEIELVCLSSNLVSIGTKHQSFVSVSRRCPMPLFLSRSCFWWMCRAVVVICHPVTWKSKGDSPS